ncbi:hypothetical protein [Rubinisphaera margarita]|uniref:hypothetical protein n=1 Tax=Rubinisphaera margarita TaxID=2909586 RepID=UPI001EE9A63F|nr:hypothetical protein [Rubinisphaera margarita]MCG6157896.1 hypothetical protein [Rubinisphaera margarita]
MTSDITAMQPASSASEVKPRRRGWSLAGFVLLNLWIVFHLLAIVSAPLSVSPSSNLERGLWMTMSPYVQILYQNNGFHFFAPNPEGSNSVRYVLEFEDGRTLEGKFPNRDISPRLLYHRYFMLSETLGALGGEARERMVRDFARQLCRDYGAERATLFLEWHELARRERILAGGSLFDDDLYQVTPLGTFTWDELSKSSNANVATTSAE